MSLVVLGFIVWIDGRNFVSLAPSPTPSTFTHSQYQYHRAPSTSCLSRRPRLAGTTSPHTSLTLARHNARTPFTSPSRCSLFHAQTSNDLNYAREPRLIPTIPAPLVASYCIPTVIPSRENRAKRWLVRTILRSSHWLTSSTLTWYVERHDQRLPYTVQYYRENKTQCWLVQTNLRGYYWLTKSMLTS